MAAQLLLHLLKDEDLHTFGHFLLFFVYLQENSHFPEQMHKISCFRSLSKLVETNVLITTDLIFIKFYSICTDFLTFLSMRDFL